MSEPSSLLDDCTFQALGNWLALAAIDGGDMDRGQTIVATRYAKREYDKLKAMLLRADAEEGEP